jgi:hypothetical protein
LNTSRELTPDSFDPVVGTKALVISVDTEVCLELMEVKKLGQGEREGGSYSLLWQGPKTPFLSQATYRISHALIGERDIFLVPVDEKAAGIQSEAIFT